MFQVKFTRKHLALVHKKPTATSQSDMIELRRKTNHVFVIKKGSTAQFPVIVYSDALLAAASPNTGDLATVGILVSKTDLGTGAPDYNITLGNFRLLGKTHDVFLLRSSGQTTSKAPNRIFGPIMLPIKFTPNGIRRSYLYVRLFDKDGASFVAAKLSPMVIDLIPHLLNNMPQAKAGGVTIQAPSPDEEVEYEEIEGIKYIRDCLVSCTNENVNWIVGMIKGTGSDPSFPENLFADLNIEVHGVLSPIPPTYTDFLGDVPTQAADGEVQLKVQGYDSVGNVVDGAEDSVTFNQIAPM